MGICGKVKRAVSSFSTNNGNFELGSNIPEQKKLDEYTDGYGFPIYPIGKYPPNPLGLYDMGLSGAEWSNDWYSTDYYSHSLFMILKVQLRVMKKF